ncbi:MAG TPA: hypothetical protein VF942_05000 [Acidimicrobiales bacterium]|nr:hypothetical protein [Actinomycetota bacterium]
MIVVRNVFHTKFGHAGELVAAFKETFEQSAADPDVPTVPSRLYTDLSGRFFTVVLESEHESLAAFEQFRAKLFSTPRFQAMAGRMGDLVESGEAEYYTLEATVSG